MIADKINMLGLNMTAKITDFSIVHRRSFRGVWVSYLLTRGQFFETEGKEKNKIKMIQHFSFVCGAFLYI